MFSFLATWRKPKPAFIASALDDEFRAALLRMTERVHVLGAQDHLVLGGKPAGRKVKNAFAQAVSLVAEIDAIGTECEGYEPGRDHIRRAPAIFRNLNLNAGKMADVLRERMDRSDELLVGIEHWHEGPQAAIKIMGKAQPQEKTLGEFFVAAAHPGGLDDFAHDLAEREQRLRIVYKQDQDALQTIINNVTLKF